LDLFSKVITQIPSLAVLCFIVHRFIIFLEARNKEAQDLINQFLTLQHETTEAINKNSLILSEITIHLKSNSN